MKIRIYGWLFAVCVAMSFAFSIGSCSSELSPADEPLNSRLADPGWQANITVLAETLLPAPSEQTLAEARTASAYVESALPHRRASWYPGWEDCDEKGEMNAPC